MQTIDKQTIKNKAFVMSTIMKDSKLAKFMADAWNAPAGSTKNTKAKAILKSLHQTHRNYIMDGMGGTPAMIQNPLDAFVQSITKKNAIATPTTLSSGATVPTSTASPTFVAEQQPTITGTPSPTTPNITAEQVKNSFESFGYEPDLNHMNDTGYWMTKPVTEISKLIGELRKRREKENTILEERNQKVETESRLSPDRIKQLYDTHGLGEQIKSEDDIKRIQNILPNDEKALTPILQAEQKRKLAVYKEKLSPSIKKQDGKGGAGTSAIPPNPLATLLAKEQVPISNPFYSLSSPTTPSISSNYGLNLIGGNTLPTTPTSSVMSSVKGLSINPTTPLDLTSPLTSSTDLSLDPTTGRMKQSITNKPDSYSSLSGLVQSKLEAPQYGFNPKTGIMEKLIPGQTPESMGWLTTKKSVTPSIISNKEPLKSSWTQDGANQLYQQYIAGGYTSQDAQNAVKRLTNFSPTVIPESTEQTAPTNIPGSTTSISKPWYETSNIEDAITSGTGPTAFGTNILSNRKKLAEFLGMPEESLKSFMPEESGLLSAQLAGIYEAETKAHGLDAAYQNMVDSANRNLNIEDNLSSYIRGKDEYLGTIDKLIDQGSNLIANTDTSNPYVAKQLGNYMNYLNILQGRQNQRYINMLDLAIKSDNNEYQQATNLYNEANKKVTDDYNRIGAVTTEFYNNTMNIVKEMYDNVATRDEKIQQTFDFEMKKIEAMDNAATKAMDILKKQKDMGLPLDMAQLQSVYPGATPEELQSYANNMTSGGNYDKITNLDIANNLMGISTDSKTGTITFSDYNPMSAIDTAAKSQNYDPAILFKQYTQATGKNIEQKASTGKFEGELNAFAPALSTMYQVAVANPNLDNGYQSIKDTIKSSLKKGLESFLSTKKDRLKEAIKSLSGEGWLTGKQTNREKFISSFSDLGDVAGLLFDINSASGGLGSSNIVDSQFDLLVQQLVLQATNGTNQ